MSCGDLLTIGGILRNQGGYTENQFVQFKVALNDSLVYSIARRLRSERRLTRFLVSVVDVGLAEGGTF